MPPTLPLFYVRLLLLSINNKEQLHLPCARRCAKCFLLAPAQWPPRGSSYHAVPSWRTEHRHQWLEKDKPAWKAGLNMRAARWASRWATPQPRQRRAGRICCQAAGDVKPDWASWDSETLILHDGATGRLCRISPRGQSWSLSRNKSVVSTFHGVSD